MPHGGNDIAWRCEYPAKAVGARTEIVPEADFHDIVMYPHTDGPMPWVIELEYMDGRQETITSRDGYSRWLGENPDWQTTVLGSCVRFPDHEGAAIWVRPDLARAAHAEKQREAGIRTLAEVDDNYLCPPRQSMALRSQAWTKGVRYDHLMAHASMDAIVFSTELLRDMYWKKIKKLFRRNAKHKGAPHLGLFVCRNNVPDDCWPTPTERDGPIRVGWMGSPSHLWDVNRAWLAMRHAKELGAETWMVGYNPVDDNLHSDIVIDGEPWRPSKQSQFNIDQWRKVGFRSIPWRTPAQYERFAMPFDIGLCPLKTNQNTLGKSDVKFVEYTISGAATVAQNNAVYNRTIVHGETGLLTDSEQDMAHAVELLMRDENLRQRLVANAQQYVREQRGTKQLREEWGYAIAG